MAKRKIYQWKSEFHRDCLGGDALSFFDKGVRFHEVLWTDPSVRVHCSATAQVEQRHVRVEASGYSDDDAEAVDSVCAEMSCLCEPYSLGGTDLPAGGVDVDVNEDATEDEVTEELNANWR